MCFCCCTDLRMMKNNSTELVNLQLLCKLKNLKEYQEFLMLLIVYLKGLLVQHASSLTLYVLQKTTLDLFLSWMCLIKENGFCKLKYRVFSLMVVIFYTYFLNILILSQLLLVYSVNTILF